MRPIVVGEAWQDLAYIFDPAAETCAFMVGRVANGRPRILEFWPVPNVWEERRTQSGRPGRAADQGYAIAAEEWATARAMAAAAGLVLIGHCHTHPGSTAAPSFWDYRTVKANELGAVWHLHSGRFTLFDRSRVLRAYVVELPPVLRALADLAASPASDLDALPAPQPVRPPPVPDDVRARAESYLGLFRNPRRLEAALRTAGLADLSMTEVTPEKVEALARALADSRN